MNPEFRLITNLNDARVSKRGGVTTEIYFQLGDVAFPEAGWRDFPVVLLTWWLQQLDSPADQICLEFMDGPYSIEVSGRGHLRQLKCIERHRQGATVRCRFEISFADIKDVVEAAAEDVLKVSLAMGADADDTAMLQDAMSSNSDWFK